MLSLMLSLSHAVQLPVFHIDSVGIESNRRVLFDESYHFECIGPPYLLV